MHIYMYINMAQKQTHEAEEQKNKTIEVVFRIISPIFSILFVSKLVLKYNQHMSFESVA